MYWKTAGDLVVGKQNQKSDCHPKNQRMAPKINWLGQGNIKGISCHSFTMVSFHPSPGEGKLGSLVPVGWRKINDKLYCVFLLLMFMYIVLVPTCQVRAFRFYQRWFLLPSSFFLLLRQHRIAQLRAPDIGGHCRPQLGAPDLSGHCQTSTASVRSQWALPELNRERQISVGTAGSQPRAPDLSGHCRTSTASSRSQCAGPLRSGTCGWGPAVPMSEKMSERMPDRTPESMSPYRPERVSAYMPESMSEQMPKNVRAYARKRKNVRVCLGFCFDKRNKVYRDSTKFNNADFGVIEPPNPQCSQSVQSIISTSAR